MAHNFHKKGCTHEFEYIPNLPYQRYENQTTNLNTYLFTYLQLLHDNQERQE